MRPVQYSLLHGTKTNAGISYLILEITYANMEGIVHTLCVRRILLTSIGTHGSYQLRTSTLPQFTYVSEAKTITISITLAYYSCTRVATRKGDDDAFRYLYYIAISHIISHESLVETLHVRVHEEGKPCTYIQTTKPAEMEEAIALNSGSKSVATLLATHSEPHRVRREGTASSQHRRTIIVLQQSVLVLETGEVNMVCLLQSLVVEHGSTSAAKICHPLLVLCM